MKKLTAGIFATILGLTAVDAFAASNVASTKYVQGAIDSLATVAKTGDYGDLTNKPTIPSIEGLATTDYVDQAELDAIAAAAAAAEKYIDTDELKTSQDAQDVVLKKYADDAVTTGTADMATKTWVGQQGYVTSGALEAEGFATTGYVDQAELDAIAAAAAAAEKYIDTDELKTSQDAQDVVLKKYADDAVTTGTADMATKTWVGQQGYVTSGALEAEGFATTGYVDQAEADAIKAAADAAVLLYVPLTAVVDSYPDASLNQQGQ